MDSEMELLSNCFSFTEAFLVYFSLTRAFFALSCVAFDFLSQGLSLLWAALHLLFFHKGFFLPIRFRHYEAFLACVAWVAGCYFTLFLTLLSSWHERFKIIAKKKVQILISFDMSDLIANSKLKSLFPLAINHSNANSKKNQITISTCHWSFWMPF